MTPPPQSIRWITMSACTLMEHFSLSPSGLLEMARRKKWRHATWMHKVYQLPAADLDDKGDGRRRATATHATALVRAARSRTARQSRKARCIPPRGSVRETHRATGDRSSPGRI
ncbi:hypothetical protein [Rhizobium sp. LjRoot258]|uniref:hypothetical protein n=1 Tax=Rhizobium sp. LjRoot258 TaxID=3342299 RepID=UPI003ED0DF80